MERSHTLYAVTLRRLLLSAPLLLALSAPLAAHTQVQKTDARLAQAAKAVEAVTQEPGAAIGGIHGDVTGGPVGLPIEGKGGYVLAQAKAQDKKQQQLGQKMQQQRASSAKADDTRPSPVRQDVFNIGVGNNTIGQNNGTGIGVGQINQ
jgi:hypothetical protein